MRQVSVFLARPPQLWIAEEPYIKREIVKPLFRLPAHRITSSRARLGRSVPPRAGLSYARMIMSSRISSGSSLPK